MDPPISQAHTDARFAAEIAKHMRRTFCPRVVENGGPEDGIFALDYDARLFARNYKRPVLVSSVAGVGPKASIARMLNRHDTIGVDLVANAVNRIVARGAEPLFFASYLESAHIDPQFSFPIVKGIADACCQAECSFIEHETPERPGGYAHGEYDLVGFALGVAERARLLADRQIEAGDAIVALPASGLHTNGHTLAKRILFDKLKMSPATRLDSLDCSIGEELIRPTAIYAKPLKRLLRHYRVKKVVRGIACVGDGGLTEALRRVLPDHFSAKVNADALPKLPILDALRALGELEPREMFDIFNMGAGVVMIVSSFYANSMIRRLRRSKQDACVIGEVFSAPKAVVYDLGSLERRGEA